MVFNEPEITIKTPMRIVTVIFESIFEVCPRTIKVNIKNVGAENSKNHL